MDFLSQDREIAPELVAILTEKLRNAKESLELAEQEKRQLREELAYLQSRSHSQGLVPKLEYDLDTAFSCKAGICPSMDTVKSLTETIRELEGQLEVAAQEHTVQVEKLRERLEKTKVKYKECKTKLKEYCKESKQPEHTPIALENDDDDKAQQSGAVDHPQELNKPNKSDEDQAAKDAQRNLWRKMATEPCLPYDIDRPSQLSPEIRHLSHWGFLFYPVITIVKPAEDYATIYMPVQKCQVGPTLTWFPNSDFDRHIHKTRDLFYSNDNGVCYAGTFGYRYRSEVSHNAFRKLEKNFRDGLFGRTFTVHPSQVPQQAWEAVYKMYWNGEATIMAYHLERIDFNQPLFDAMLAARGPIATDFPFNSDTSTESKPSKSKKRKPNQQWIPVPKRLKS